MVSTSHIICEMRPMKHMPMTIICMLLILMVVTGAYAREGNTLSVISKNPVQKTSMNLVGKVVSATYADAVNGTKSEIVVVDSKGVAMNSIILDTTTMYDEKGHAITRDKITKGKSVKVKYTISDTGIIEALSIKLTP